MSATTSLDLAIKAIDQDVLNLAIKAMPTSLDLTNTAKDLNVLAAPLVVLVNTVTDHGVLAATSLDLANNAIYHHGSVVANEVIARECYLYAVLLGFSVYLAKENGALIDRMSEDLRETKVDQTHDSYRNLADLIKRAKFQKIIITSFAGIASAELLLMLGKIIPY